MTKIGALLFACIIFLGSRIYAEPITVDVVGLFKHAAMLDISGKPILLRVGDTSPQGVTLISADSKEAVIVFEGVERTLNLSMRIGASFKVPEKTSISILLNNLGQYRTKGSINGRSTVFLVDTGANVVAMNTVSAMMLGLNGLKGIQTNVVTASGTAISRRVTLDSVSVGGIKMTQVDAVIIEGEYPKDILLGMSYLKGVEIRKNAGVMQLTGKY